MFGPGKGVSFEQFVKLVKTLTIVYITGNERKEFYAPLTDYNKGINQYPR